eukprot:TRINITY_DN31203_c0_g1_i1.p1 TRINITY_DN31203_c0_g1~~TRINITY_DN31203_c0_g1_i1.p1  ORF type:complete len:983 (-),score=255.91 TRINITY_DN31203_c0_g1_i1:173-3121(-)
MGKKLEALFRRSFKASKCCSLLRMIVDRIRLLKNKREIQCAQYKKDICLLLQKGQIGSARSRVELLFKEQNILGAYVLIEGFCYLVMERIVAIEKQKTCPGDLKEAIASLVFAAPRCADLPELQEIRSIFTAKYGPEFITEAVELYPDNAVNKQIIEHLATRSLSADVKLWLMKEIAAENGVEWDFEKAEREMLKPTEDMKRVQKGLAGEDVSPKLPERTERKTPLKNENSFHELQKDSVRETAGQPDSAFLSSFPHRSHGNMHSYEGKVSTRTNDAEASSSEPPFVKTSGTKDAVKVSASHGDVYNRFRMEDKMDYRVEKGKEKTTTSYKNQPKIPNNFASLAQGNEAELVLDRQAKREGSKEITHCQAWNSKYVGDEQDVVPVKASGLEGVLSDGNVYSRLRVEGKMDYKIKKNSENTSKCYENEATDQSNFVSPPQVTKVGRPRGRLTKREGSKHNADTQSKNLENADSEHGEALGLKNSSLAGSITQDIYSRLRIEGKMDYDLRKPRGHASFLCEGVPNALHNFHSPSELTDSECALGRQTKREGSKQKANSHIWNSNDVDPEHNEAFEAASVVSSGKNTQQEDVGISASKMDKVPVYDDDCNYTISTEEFLPFAHGGKLHNKGINSKKSSRSNVHNSTNDYGYEKHVNSKHASNTDYKSVETQYHSEQRNTKASQIPASGTVKSSFETFLRQQTQSFDRFDATIDDGASSLNDFEKLKFKSHRPPTGRRRVQEKGVGASTVRGLSKIPSIDRLSSSEYSEPDSTDDFDYKTPYDDNALQSIVNQDTMEVQDIGRRMNHGNRWKNRIVSESLGTNMKSYPQVQQPLEDSIHESPTLESQNLRMPFDSTQSAPDGAVCQQDRLCHQEDSHRSSMHDRHSTRMNKTSLRKDIVERHKSPQNSPRTRPSRSPPRAAGCMESRVNYDSLFDIRAFIDSPPPERRGRSGEPKVKHPPEKSSTPIVDCTDEELQARFEALKRKK